MPCTHQPWNAGFRTERGEQHFLKKIISIKYDVANNQLDKFDQYKQDIDTFYDNIMEKKRLMPEQLHS